MCNFIHTYLFMLKLDFLFKLTFGLSEDISAHRFISNHFLQAQVLCFLSEFHAVTIKEKTTRYAYFYYKSSFYSFYVQHFKILNTFLLMKPRQIVEIAPVSQMHF